MKIGTFDGKLVEEVANASSPVVFLKVVRDEDKNKCPHCGGAIPTEIVSVVSSLNHKEGWVPYSATPPLTTGK